MHMSTRRMAWPLAHAVMAVIALAGCGTKAGEGGRMDGSGGASEVTPIAPGDPTANRMGINIGAASYYDAGRMFADMMVTAYRLSTGNVDENGWPLDGAFTVDVSADRGLLNGTYTLYFQGRATSVSGGDGVTGLSYDAGKNQSTAKVQVNDAGVVHLPVRFVGATRNDGTGRAGATKIRLMRPLTPGSATSYAETELFTQQLAALVQKFQVVRFMDFLATNWSQQRVWADRTLPTTAFWGRDTAPAYHDTTYGGGQWGWQGRGGPYEYAILFANAMKRDAWINLPAGADDDYVQRVAQMFLYGSDGKNPYASPQANPVFPPLAPGLRLYVEYSNEVWNGSFGVQFNMNIDLAQAEVAAGNSPLDFDKAGANKWELGYRRMAKRGVEISKIFRSVFGDAAMMTRVRPVYMSQAYNAWVGFQGLRLLHGYYNNGEGDFVSDPHPPSYYFYGAGGAAYYNPDNNSGSLTVDNIWDSFSMSVATWSGSVMDQGFVPGVWNVAALGVKSVAYEGGPDMYYTGSGEAAKAAAWGDPRMADSVVGHHEAWSSFGGDVLVYFTAARPGTTGTSGRS